MTIRVLFAGWHWRCPGSGGRRATARIPWRGYLDMTPALLLPAVILSRFACRSQPLVVVALTARVGLLYFGEPLLSIAPSPADLYMLPFASPVPTVLRVGLRCPRCRPVCAQGGAAAVAGAAGAAREAAAGGGGGRQAPAGGAAGGGGGRRRCGGGGWRGAQR